MKKSLTVRLDELFIAFGARKKKRGLTALQRGRLTRAIPAFEVEIRKLPLAREREALRIQLDRLRKVLETA